MISRIAASLRMLGFVLWTLVMIGPYSLVLVLNGPYRAISRFYWRGVARLAHLTIRTHGRLSDKRPLLVVANHVSYLDIIVLGATVQGSFVAKTEVGHWPGIGILAHLARTVFVDRRRGSTADAKEALHQRLREGDPLILFPEGTSDDGNRVLPFKSALFSVAETPLVLDSDPKDAPPRPVWVQPVSLAYTWVDGVPVGRSWRPFFAWYGDMSLMPHLFQMLGFGATRVEMMFHPPLDVAAAGSRKALAQACHATVARGLEQALTGRLPDPLAGGPPASATTNDDPDPSSHATV